MIPLGQFQGTCFLESNNSKQFINEQKERTTNRGFG